RRDTRLVSDWSSDVCSSDLPSELAGEVGIIVRQLRGRNRFAPLPVRLVGFKAIINLLHQDSLGIQIGQVVCLLQESFHNFVLLRSEERRVGKEYRYGMETMQ